jgi:hypothetical protein
MNTDSQILKFLDKIKTPLSISGLALMILYLIVKGVLNMDIYEKIGADNTYLVVERIIKYIFFIALLSIVLGVFSYIILRLPKKKVKPIIADSTTDEEVRELVIRDLKIEKKDHHTSPVEVIDFKFVNNGEDTIFITQVSIEILEAKLDLTPHFSASYSVKFGNLVIHLTNKGWGKAIINKKSLSNVVLDHFIESYGAQVMTINPGEKKEVLRYSIKEILEDPGNPMGKLLEEKEKLISKACHALINKDGQFFLTSDVKDLLGYHEIWQIEQYFKRLDEPDADSRLQILLEGLKRSLKTGIAINTNEMSVNLFYEDEYQNNVARELNNVYSNDGYGSLYLTSNGFLFNKEHVCYCLAYPEYVYASYIETDLVGKNKSYPLSHSMKRGDIERLHLLILSKQSAEYSLRFVFHYNNSGKLISDIIKVSLFNENVKDNKPHNVIDGKRFTIKKGKIMLEDETSKSKSYLNVDI